MEEKEQEGRRRDSPAENSAPLPRPLRPILPRTNSRAMDSGYAGYEQSDSYHSYPNATAFRPSALPAQGQMPSYRQNTVNRKRAYDTSFVVSSSDGLYSVNEGVVGEASPSEWPQNEYQRHSKKPRYSQPIILENEEPDYLQAATYDAREGEISRLYRDIIANFPPKYIPKILSSYPCKTTRQQSLLTCLDALQPLLERKKSPNDKYYLCQHPLCAGQRSFPVVESLFFHTITDHVLAPPSNGPKRNIAEDCSERLSRRLPHPQREPFQNAAQNFTPRQDFRQPPFQAEPRSFRPAQEDFSEEFGTPFLDNEDRVLRQNLDPLPTRIDASTTTYITDPDQRIGNETQHAREARHYPDVTNLTDFRPSTVTASVTNHRRAPTRPPLMFEPDVNYDENKTAEDYAKLYSKIPEDYREKILKFFNEQEENSRRLNKHTLVRKFETLSECVMELRNKVNASVPAGSGYPCEEPSCLGATPYHSADALFMHHAAEHICRIGERIIECQKCHLFISKKIKVHDCTAPDTQNVGCGICQMRFEHGGAYRDHVKMLHSSGGKQHIYTCDLCNKSWGRRMLNLIVHIATRHPFGAKYAFGKASEGGESSVSTADESSSASAPLLPGFSHPNAQPLPTETTGSISPTTEELDQVFEIRTPTRSPSALSPTDAALAPDAEDAIEREIAGYFIELFD